MESLKISPRANFPRGNASAGATLKRAVRDPTFAASSQGRPRAKECGASEVVFSRHTPNISRERKAQRTQHLTMRSERSLTNVHAIHREREREGGLETSYI